MVARPLLGHVSAMNPGRSSRRRVRPSACERLTAVTRSNWRTWHPRRKVPRVDRRPFRCACRQCRRLAPGSASLSPRLATRTSRSRSRADPGLGTGPEGAAQHWPPRTIWVPGARSLFPVCCLAKPMFVPHPPLISSVVFPVRRSKPRLAGAARLVGQYHRHSRRQAGWKQLPILVGHGMQS